MLFNRIFSKFFFRLTSSAAIAFVALATMTSNAMANDSDDMDICHWQDYNGAWKLITVSENGALNHLRLHDDAFPGGVTSVNSIQLDENCAEIASCGNCLEAHDGPGCSNTACQDAVVAEDFVCGLLEDWDTICAGEATVYCANICDVNALPLP